MIVIIGKKITRDLISAGQKASFFTSMGWNVKSGWLQYLVFRVWLACMWLRILPSSVQSFQAGNIKIKIKNYYHKIRIQNKKTNLDFNRVEDLSVVNSNNWSDHGWNNDHITKVCLDNVWLLVGSSCTLDRFNQLLLQGDVLSLQSLVCKSSTATCWEQFDQLCVRNIQQVFYYYYFFYFTINIFSLFIFNQN